MTHLQFAQPHWLWIGALCCAALVALLARAGRLRRQALSSLAGARFVTTVGRGRRLAKQLLVLLGIAATFVALARPLAGFRWEEERRDGIDLMFAVDTSKSMLATDLRPDRLTRAKLAVSDLLRKFPGERVGLIAFAGEAFVQAPMTIDQAVFGEALDALDTSIIPRGGTDIASPIRAAIEAMASEPDRRKLLVILSDGEDLAGEAVAAAKDAAHAGLVIYTVGVGTRAGALIPVEHDGQRELLRDADGRFVTSHLDEQTLRQLAAMTGGAYAPLGSAGQGLETLYRQHLAQLPHRAVEERMHKIYTERFQIPLAVAIGCLLAELALGERRRRPDSVRSRRSGSHRSGSHQSIRPVATAAALLLLTAGAARPAVASTTAPAASTYNDGTTAYEKKDFAAARDRFQAATHTTDLSIQEDAYYDLGNARYRVGQATLSQDRQATIEAWKGAVASYDGALALQPKDADAQFNRDLVARRLAALEKQERQERQEQQDRQPKNQQGQKNEKAPKQGQGQPQNDKAPKQGQGQQPQPSQSSSGQGQGSSSSPQGDNQTSPQEQHGAKGGGQQGTAGQQQTGREQREGQNKGQIPEQNKQQNQGQNKEQHAEQNQPPQGAGVVSGQPGQSTAHDQPAVARRAPGALSPSEAVQLLDSVSGELHRLPVADARRRQAVDDRDAPSKDW